MASSCTRAQYSTIKVPPAPPHSLKRRAHGVAFDRAGRQGKKVSPHAVHAIAFPRSESAQQHSSELTLAAVKLAEDSRSACSAISVSRRGAPSSIRSSEPSSIARNKIAELELRLKLERVRELDRASLAAREGGRGAEGAALGSDSKIRSSTCLCAENMSCFSRDSAAPALRRLGRAGREAPPLRGQKKFELYIPRERQNPLHILCVTCSLKSPDLETPSTGHSWIFDL